MSEDAPQPVGLSDSPSVTAKGGRRRVRLLVGGGIAVVVVAAVVVLVVSLLGNSSATPAVAGSSIQCTHDTPPGIRCMPGDFGLTQADVKLGVDFECTDGGPDTAAKDQPTCTSVTTVDQDPGSGSALPPNPAMLSIAVRSPNPDSRGAEVSGFTASAAVAAGSVNEIRLDCTALAKAFTSAVGAVFVDYGRVRSDLVDRLTGIRRDCATRSTPASIPEGVVDGYKLTLGPPHPSDRDGVSSYVADISVDAVS